MKLELCQFSGYKILPGHGKRLIRTDGKVLNFLNSKCAACYMMKRNPRSTAWTVLYRRKHKKGSEEEVKRRRARRNVKYERAVVGATLSEIRTKRDQKPEVRKAQREQLIRAAKEKAKQKEDKKKLQKLGQAGKPLQQKQKATKVVKAAAPKVGGKR